MHCTVLYFCEVLQITYYELTDLLAERENRAAEATCKLQHARQQCVLSLYIKPPALERASFTLKLNSCM